MKAQKSLAVLATVSLLALSVGCNDRYAEGITEGKKQGYEEGYDAGYVDGDKDGFERAKTYFASADYNDGFNDGKTQGISIGYSQGYNVGKTDGVAQGYTQGYNVGKTDGYSDGYDDGDYDGYARGYSNGYDDGEFDGFNAGFDAGYDDGAADGYELGYDVGWEDGWDAGFEDGYDSAFSLSVGKTKKLKGYANVISAFHNDLIDYSKIAAPKATKRGLVVNGQLLLSETSTTNKDTLKRAAVVEQYLVVEMAKQVKGKFGLSAERSLKVAKAANHFRKYSSNRALTAEDTNAYASEIIGADFKSLEKAYENTMKGNLSDLNSIIEKAAEKNGVSPEKMGQIVTELFI